MLRYTPISSSFYVENRKRVCENLLPYSISIITSNDVLPTNADGIMGFRQNNDIFYLTGIDQEKTTLVLFPNHPEEELREVLFIRETNEYLKVWEGEKLTKKEAYNLSGIKKILWESQLESFLQRHIFDAEIIYLTDNEHDGKEWDFQTAQNKLNKKINENYPLHTIKRIAPILRNLREIKFNVEIKQIKKAIGISKIAFENVAQTLKNGMYEFEIEAELTYNF